MTLALIREVPGDQMPWFRMDDSIYDDPAVSRVGNAAFGLYSRCGAYAARHLLDGFIPSDFAAQYGSPEWIRKLLDAGLWETAEGGYFMPRYLTDNPSRDKVLAERKAKSERQSRWLEKKQQAKADMRRVSRPVSRRVSDASQDAPEDAALPPSLTGRKGAARASAASAARAARQEKPPWCGSCNETTRLVEIDDNGTPAQCVACHPVASKEFRS